MRGKSAKGTEKGEDMNSDSHNIPTEEIREGTSSLGRRTLFKLAGATLALAGIDTTAANVETTRNPMPQKLGSEEYRFKNQPKDYINPSGTGHVPLDVEKVGNQLFVRSYRDGCYSLDLDTGEKNWKLEGDYTQTVHHEDTSYLVSDHSAGTLGDEMVMSVDNSTGEVNWIADQEINRFGRHTRGCGPVVDSMGNLVMVVDEEAPLHLTSIDRQTGDTRWTYSAGSHGRAFYYTSGELSDQIYVFPDDHPLTEHAEDRSLLAVDAHSGSELWCHEPRHSVEDANRRYLSVLEFEHTVCRMLPDGRVIGLSKDTGREKWSRVYDIEDSSTDLQLRLKGRGETGLYLLYMEDQEPPTTQILEHLDSGTGQTRWTREARKISTNKEHRSHAHHPPEIREIQDTTLIVTEDSLDAVDRETGEELWIDSKPEEVFVREDHLYHVHDDRVQMVDQSSGETLWSVEIPEPAEHYRDITPVPEQDRLYLVKKGYYTGAGGKKEGDELVVREMRRK